MLVAEYPNRPLPWFALYVLPRHEKAVDRQLNQIGYQSFLPIYQSRRKWSDRVKSVDLPLFPGYVFCRLDTDRPLKAVSVPGVCSIVRCGPDGGAISDPEIDALRRLTEVGRGLEPWTDLAVGVEVQVEAGPMAGVRGTLMRFRKETRLIVSIKQIERSISVEVDREDVRPVPCSARREADPKLAV